MEEITKERVLTLFCNTTVSIMNKGFDIIPSTAIAKYFGCSLYRARKVIRQLIDEGLLESGTECINDDSDEMPCICRSYRLTKIARASREYRMAQWKEAKICSVIWGGGSAWDYYNSFQETDNLMMGDQNEL